MSFDPRSLEYLREIGRKLPQELPKPRLSHDKETKESIKQNPNNTEKDPQVLFQKLIQASPDGNVPSHLIAKLKEVESNQQVQNDCQKPIHSRETNPNNSQSEPNENAKEEEILYASFNRFLLEEEED